MVRNFTATVAFATELGEKKVFPVSFSVKQTEDSTIEQLVEDWAIFAGYEHLHANNIPSYILTEDGFFYDKTLEVVETK